MENSTKAFVLTGIVAAIGLVVCVGSYVSNANYGNRTEQAIKSTYEDNKNILGTCTNKILEVAQVPGMYRDDLMKVVSAEMQGRYQGEKGKLANFIQERSLNYDSSLYHRVQNEMTACSNRFESAQSKLIDQKRAYQTSLGNVWSGMWLGMAGYPKVDLDKFNIVLAEDTQQIFETGKRSPIRLRENGGQ